MKYILLAFFSLFYSFSFSQGEFVVEINNTNGTFIKTGPPIAGITYISPGIRTYNENAGIFIFPSVLITHSLYSINTSNGSIVYNPIIGNISEFQYDNATDMLYGLEQDNANNVKNFISIDPATGNYTQIGNSMPGSGLFQGFGTFDEINNIYIFLDPPDILTSINAANGNIISNPSLVLASGEAIIHFAFDNSTGTLYGLLQDSNLQKYFLVTINTTTGINTRITPGGLTSASGGGSSTIDEINQQYICLYSQGGNYHVTTLSLATGNLEYQATMHPFNPLDNFFSLEYDNVKGKLYSIHWESDTTVSIKQNRINNHISFNPNPFSSLTSLRTNNNLKDATLTIFNSSGQTVKQVKSIYGKSFTLYRDNFQSGLYFYQLSQDKKIIKTGKLLIE